MTWFKCMGGSGGAGAFSVLVTRIWDEEEHEYTGFEINRSFDEIKNAILSKQAIVAELMPSDAPNCIQSIPIVEYYYDDSTPEEFYESITFELITEGGGASVTESWKSVIFEYIYFERLNESETRIESSSTEIRGQSTPL